MDDDDEFGDLYTDVLRPLTASSAPEPPPIRSTSTFLSGSTDLNLHSDDEEIIYGAPNSKQPNSNISQRNQIILGFETGKPQESGSIVAGGSGSHRDLNQVDKKESLADEVGNTLDASDSPDRFLESGGVVKVEEKSFEGPNFMDDPEIDVVVDERDDKGDVLVDKDEILVGITENLQNFDTEEGNTAIRDTESEPMIPGLSIPGVSDSKNNLGADFLMRGEGSGEGDDWDSDSEDDLQIVLNDNDHGPMSMDRIGVAGADDDEDEDGDPLVIVGDGDPNHPPMEEQDWGEDAAHAADGERKELGDAAKVNGAVVQPPKFGYSSHGYHPFHSQFKYVRPGVVPMPGAAPVAPGGAPGQLRPPVNMGPIAGRGRGDWRPAGIKSALPMQKSFHPGYVMPAWGNNTSGRGFGSGLDFTLPSHKTIFEVDIDSFEEKPWRLPGIEISDFFNFGLNEETWKDYCKQLEQLRLEATMQSKIRVYESGRTEQEYDPDMPPELAAAAGIHDVSSENANLEKADAGQNDLAKGSARMRPQLPTGRAIQVETGYGERLPSIDTRPPRIRDSDAIIEIVLQDSADDIADQPENDPSREDLSGGHEIEEDATHEDTEHFDSMPQAYDDRKRELVGRRAPVKNSVHDKITEGDPISPFLAEAPVQYCPDSRGQSSVHPGRNFNVPRDGRRPQGRARDRSPNMSPSETTQDKRFIDNQKEESVESVDGKPSLPLSSPVTVGNTEERHFEHKGAMHDEVVLADGSSEMEREEMAFDTTTTTDSLKDENLMHSVKKQKLSSQVEQPSLREFDDGEDSKAERSSENSKARSGSSRDYRNFRDGLEEEVVQDGRSTRMGIINRPLGDDERSVRSKDYDDRQEMQRHRMTMKGREDPYYRKNWDSNPAHHSHKKTESIDRRRESDNSDGAWQRKDEDPHGRRTRAEDTRKRELGDETGSRYRSKVRENERSDKDEYQSRKQLDNGSWRGHHDKDMGSRHRDRDDSLKTRNENLDDLNSKRRKEEVQLRREHAEKEEILHAHRENTSRRKREREDILDHLPNKKDMLDQRKREDQTRLRNDDQRSVRHKEEGGWFQRERVERHRERDEWHGLKQTREGSLSKREREEVRGGVRGGRTAEDKAWISHSRVKDEYKGSDRDYHFKDTGRHSEQPKRRDRVENESLSRQRVNEDVYARGNQLNNEERRSRQEKGSSRSDRAVNASDNHRVHEKKHKENPRKSKESEGDHNSSAPSRRNQEGHGGQISERVRLRVMTEQEIPLNRQSSRKHKEDASSDDEQQDSRRGRSKLERWTSHKERDFSIGSKPSASSLNVKEINNLPNESSIASKLLDESSKTVGTIENDPHPLDDEKDGGEPEIKNADVKPMEDRHLDTVEKLKKRSERFKLPMPSEKEALAIKKMESEPLPSSQTETRADSEIKHERPPRKRRWTSN